jgi:glycosyltransferase involved in cell wall biosynthesis
MATNSRSILVAAHRFSRGFGGVPESILMLANELAAAGVRVDVICRDGLIADVGRLRELPAAGRLRLNEGWRIDPRAYQAVFVAGAWNPLALWLGIRARCHGIRLVYAAKGNLARAEFRRPRDIRKIPYLLTLELILLGLSQRIIFSSKIERDSFVLGPIFKGRAGILPEPFHGPKPSYLAPASDRPVLRFGFLAEIAPRKGLKELVQAFLQWREEDGVAAELHIVGEPRPGSEGYCQAIRQHTAGTPAIQWHGPLRGSARDEFYETIDFLVCPTRFESFGLTPLEALWRGKPVILTAAMGVLEFISDQSSIIKLKNGSTPALLDGFRNATARSERLAEAAQAWRSRLQPGLSGPSLVGKFLLELGFEDAPVMTGLDSVGLAEGG